MVDRRSRDHPQPTDLDADGSHLTLYAAPDDSREAAGTQILVYEGDVTPLS